MHGTGGPLSLPTLHPGYVVEKSTLAIIWLDTSPSCLLPEESSPKAVPSYHQQTSIPSALKKTAVNACRTLLAGLVSV